MGSSFAFGRIAVHLVLALTSIAAFSGTALAADMAVKVPVYNVPPPVAVYNWTGFHVGGNAGWMGSGGNITNTGTDTGTLGLEPGSRLASLS